MMNSMTQMGNPFHRWIDTPASADAVRLHVLEMTPPTANGRRVEYVRGAECFAKRFSDSNAFLVGDI